MSDDTVIDIFVILSIIIIIYLKCIDIIPIPWIWLLCPIWIPFLIGIIVATVLVCKLFFVFLEEKRGEKNERN